MKYIITLFFLAIPVFVFSVPIISARERIQNFEEVREQKMIEAQNKVKEMIQRAEEIKEQKAEEIAEKQEMFRAKINEIKDEKLRNRAEILSKNINKVNYNLSNRHTGLIGAMEIVLDKLESRVDKIETEKGIDLPDLYEKINEARELIEDIKEKIISQKSNVYVVDISSEQNIRLDFQEKIREMRKDHEELREEVHNYLRSLIREIINSLKDINQ